jgi:hypothetical protein
VSRSSFKRSLCWCVCALPASIAWLAQNFAAECTAVAAWRPWEVWIHRLCVVYYPLVRPRCTTLPSCTPFRDPGGVDGAAQVVLWQHYTRRRRLRALLLMMEQHDKSFLRNARAQVVDNSIVAGYSPCYKLCWIDMLVPSQVRASTRLRRVSHSRCCDGVRRCVLLCALLWGATWCRVTCACDGVPCCEPVMGCDVTSG